ncbi:protein D2-like [Chrysoperla carnea]|uniref:protein D2-like n=1 Tax=Chrysoperla carnea TaxID=189513 RepID=UPI001D089B8D|nr:protein D2-like [Chrysoperla carnea]
MDIERNFDATIMWQLLVFIVAVLGQIFANVEQAFTENEIVPDSIDIPPNKFMEIIYPDDAAIELGNFLAPTQTLKVPLVKFNGEPNKYYLLVMTDPDCPSRAQPTLREMVHWLVGNIPADNVFSGETLVEYLPAAPPENSGIRRYIFLIYEQPGQIEFDEPRITNNSLSGRLNFSIRNFANKYGFGEPIFGNFFNCQYDPASPTIHSMFGISNVPKADHA